MHPHLFKATEMQYSILFSFIAGEHETEQFLTRQLLPE
jgi:hypothetical protein